METFWQRALRLLFLPLVFLLLDSVSALVQRNEEQALQVFFFFIILKSLLRQKLLLLLGILIDALNYLELKPNVLSFAEWLEYVHHKLEQGLQLEVLVIHCEHTAANLIHIEHILDE